MFLPARTGVRVGGREAGQLGRWLHRFAIVLLAHYSEIALLVSNSGERVLDSLGGDGRRAGAFVRASVTEWKYLCVMPSRLVASR
jgi:hypothetical protein